MISLLSDEIPKNPLYTLNHNKNVPRETNAKMFHVKQLNGE